MLQVTKQQADALENEGVQVYQTDTAAGRLYRTLASEKVSAILSRLPPARAAGLSRFTGQRDWARDAMPFHVWDDVCLKIDPRHLGEVTAVHFNTITVRWHNGWTSEHHHNELEKTP